MEKDNKPFVIPDYQALNEAIYKSFPAYYKLIYLCVTGSRGKQYHSHKSDYDVRAIVLNKLPQHERINTTFDGKVVEGWVIDINMLINGAVDSKYFFIEILRAPAIHNGNPEVIDAIKQAVNDVYTPHVLLNEAAGMLVKYVAKKLKTKKSDYLETVPIKNVVEASRMILDFKALFDGKNIMGHYNIEELLKFAEKEEVLIRELVEKRKADSSQETVITIAIKEFIENGLAEVSKKLKTVKGPSDMKELNERKTKCKTNVSNLLI